MALPQKAIEQLGREPVKTPGWSSRILMLSSSIFLISLAAYLGILFGYQPYLKSQLDETQLQIETFAQRIPVDQQQKIINFYSQLANLRSLLAKQKIAAAAIPWVQKNTQVNAYFTRFSLSMNENAISMPGRARTLADVAQQLVSLENLPEIKSIGFQSVSLNEDDGFWDFALNIVFEPEFFGNPEEFMKEKQP